MKRTVSLLLTLVIVIGLISSIPLTSSAAALSDLKFTLNSDGVSYSVSARNSNINGSLSIPSSFSGYPVTGISDSGFKNCNSLTTVEIPSSIKTIGTEAFYSCKNLASVTIPVGVINICEEAFWYCEKISSITIPSSVRSIGDSAFAHCKNLKSLIISNGITSIGREAFCYCESLTSLTIPQSVTDIEQGAFGCCYNLATATIYAKITSINYAVFSNCQSLTSITIPNGVTKIGDGAFLRCYSLRSIILPDSLTNIDDDAFNYCSSLSSIIFPNKLTSIGQGAFYHCSALYAVVIPKSVKTIESSAFYDCKNLKYTYYFGNLVEWNNINIEENNDPLFNNVVFNYNALKPLTPKTITTNEIGGIYVSWNKVNNATKYVIFRRQAGSKSWVNIGTTTGTTLLDKNVKSGVYYCYSVRAYSSTGKFSDYIQNNTSTRKYMQTPKLTGISNATNGINIKWNAVPGVTNGYRVYRRGAGSTYWTYLGTVKSTQAVDVGVKDASGNYFRYTVIADGGYYSAFDTTGLYLKRLANPTLTSAVSSSAGITVKWGAVKGTTGYYVYRKTANSNWVRIATVGGTNNTTYLDKTARKGTTYTYTVRAVYGATTSAYNSGISCYDKY